MDTNFPERAAVTVGSGTSRSRTSGRMAGFSDVGGSALGVGTDS